MPTKTPEVSTHIIPRIIRMKDAPSYLGMNKNHFNKAVRPFLTELRFGTQGVAFDRLDLDAWVDDFKRRANTDKQENTVCQKNHRVSPKGTNSGTSTKSSKEKEFMKALEQVTSKKRNASYVI